MTDKNIRVRESCSFCDKYQDEVRILIKAKTPDTFICNECVLLSVDLLIGLNFVCTMKLPNPAADEDNHEKPRQDE